MRTVYRSAAVAHATGPELDVDQSLLVVDGIIEYVGPDAEAPSPPADCRVVDAGGATVVPGLVDAHSHTVLPGGSHWIERAGDDTADLLRVAEENGEIAFRAGIRWLRDVGSPRRGGRALALGVRDAWAGRNDRPYIRAAGTWIAESGYISDIAVEAADGEELVAAVAGQVADGADLVKLYLDGPDRDRSPFTADEVAAAVRVAHDAAVSVTAHSTNLAGARAGVRGGVDCIEHGSELDADIVTEMAAHGVYLVPTLAILDSWESFATTTTIERFASAEGRAQITARGETARESMRLAAGAGVSIAAGTDFGGGSLRANHLAWEVEALAGAGLEPWRAMAAATWVGGDLLGEPEAGRIRQGGPAEFFLVHGDPLSDPAALWRVWKNC